MTYLADKDADHPLASLQAASCTYRIALSARRPEGVLGLRTVAGQDEKPRKVLRADAHGFSLRAAVRCGADQRKQFERLCRYITRHEIANLRLLSGKGYDRLGSLVRVRLIEKLPFEPLHRRAAAIRAIADRHHRAVE